MFEYISTKQLCKDQIFSYHFWDSTTFRYYGHLHTTSHYTLKIIYLSDVGILGYNHTKFQNS